MRRIIFFLLTTLTLVAPYQVNGQQLGFSLDEGQKKVKIPFELHSYLIVIPVVVNGKLPLRFILDTGVRTSILTDKIFTDLLNLSYQRKLTISGAGGQKLVDAYITNNVTLELPGVTGKGHALLVLEKDFLEMRNLLGTEVQGILGYELFSRFVVKIDYSKKIITLYDPSHFKPRRSFKTIPMSIEDTKPYINAPLALNDKNSLNSKLFIDTGASHGLLLESDSDERIKIPEMSLHCNIGRGLGGDITGRVGRLNSLSIGEYTINNVLASFPYPDSYSDSIKYGRVFRNGTIGGSVLSRFNLIFDFPKEKIYFKKNSAFRKSFHFNMSGIIVQASGRYLDTYEIVNVTEGSPAHEVNLRRGDEIIRINNYFVRDINLDIINGILSSKNRKKINLEVKRNGKVLRKQFRLRTLI